MISCSFINRNNFQIQTGHGTSLVETEYILSRQKFNELSDKDLKVIEKEIVDYIEKFGSKLEKQNIRKDRDYNLEHGINESSYNSYKSGDIRNLRGLTTFAVCTGESGKGILKQKSGYFLIDCNENSGYVEKIRQATEEEIELYNKNV